MRLSLIVVLSAAALAAASASSLPLEARGPQAEPRQAQPRSQAEPRRGAGTGPDQEETQRERQRQAEPRPRQAQPRPPATAPERQGPRRPAPPRVLPPRYYGSRVYHFPPVSLHRGFYYHPYFGFYYGPYYGPFYPYPGPYASQIPFSASAVRTRVKPVETQVYVNGYYAGMADDFDGLFQRLHLPAGEHEFEFYLEGHRNFRQRLYLNPGDTREIVHQMQPLAPDDTASSPQSPRALPEAWTAGTAPQMGDRPASPFGILAIRVEPAGAQILVDGEVWLGTDDQTELVIHMPAGWHDLEVRHDGYQPFSTEIELSEGSTARLNVRLVR